MLIKKAFSQACENNRQPILGLLSSIFANTKCVLEVGSGTGQHAVFFASKLPHLVWQTSDLECNHDTITAWINDYPSSNLRYPLLFDARSIAWPYNLVDGLFSANICHIMAWSSLVNFFEQLPTILAPSAILVVYGPFKYGGEFTSFTNVEFDYRLKKNLSYQGIRNFESINELAKNSELELIADHAMPANNRLLVWRYEPST